MDASPKSTAPKPARARTDGRRTLLVYLDSELIKNLKKVALDEEKNVYEIVEEATRAWLSRKSLLHNSLSARISGFFCRVGAFWAQAGAGLGLAIRII